MVEFPKSKWDYNWGIDEKNALFLDTFVKNNKPKIILETGTFEGQATYVMAQSANQNNNKCKIYTIDYNGDPTSDFEMEKWLRLKSIRDENLQKIKNNFKNVEVNFVEGDSREVLKDLFKDDDVIDLFYQDSMHFKDGIIQEWNLVEKNIIKNSKIIFDDLQLKGVQQFRDWFKNKYKNLYSYQTINVGHKQFIVNKLV
jgi:predicted O-methyltransferase YrrM